MDNWTPLRLFWTLRGALTWRNQIGKHAHAYVWKGSEWFKILRHEEIAAAIRKGE